MSAVADHYGHRTEAERIVGEDRVPTGVLDRLVADYGDAELSGPPSRSAWLGQRAAMLLVVAARRLTVRRIPVPAALCLHGVEVIEELFNAADDSELTVLDEFVGRAGLGWRCQAEVKGFPCRWMNVGASICGSCGASEAQGRKEPDG